MLLWTLNLGAGSLYPWSSPPPVGAPTASAAPVVRAAQAAPVVTLAIARI